MKKLIALLLAVLLLATLLVGCATNGEKDSDKAGAAKDNGKTSSADFEPVGEYHTKTIDGKAPEAYMTDGLQDYCERHGDEYEAFVDEHPFSEDDLKDPVVLVLNEDGTFEMHYDIIIESTDTTGTWEKNDSEITLNRADGGVVHVAIKDGNLVLKGLLLSLDYVDVLLTK